MAKNRDLNPLQPLPANQIDALNEYISTLVANVEIRPVAGSTTTIEVQASASDGQAAIGIDGRWRYRSTTVQRAHPGGVAGTYDIWVTGSDNVFVPGSPGEVDNTVYDFGLAITATGVNPVGVTLFRKIGELVWDGAAITRIRQLVGAQSDRMPLEPTARAVWETPLRVRGMAAQTADLMRVEDSAALARLRVDNAGILNLRRASATTFSLDVRADADVQARFAMQADGKMEWGDGAIARDVNLYRAGADILRTDDRLDIQRTLASDNALLLKVTAESAGRLVIKTDGQHLWGDGTSQDTNLYRSAPDTLKTDDALHVVGDISVNPGAGAASTGAVIFPRGSMGYNGGNMFISDGGTSKDFVVNLGAGAAERLRVTEFGQVRIPMTTGSTAGILIGGDANLYRSAANALRTDDELNIGLNPAANGIVLSPNGNMDMTRDGGTATGFRLFNSTLSVQDAQPRLHINVQGQLLLGPGGAVAPDTNLYRSAADTLKTDDSLIVTGPTLTAQTLTSVALHPQNTATADPTATNPAIISSGTGGTVYPYLEAGNLILGSRWAGAARDILFYTGVTPTLRVAVSRSLDGFLFGPVAGQDVNLYRSAADTLRTDDTFAIGASVSSATGSAAGVYFSASGFQHISRVGPTGLALYTDSPADAVSRFGLSIDGRHEWGDGALARDTNLYRSAADTLTTDDLLRINRSAVGSNGLWVLLNNEANPRLRIMGDGKIEWGPGGAGAVDTNLYRRAADELATDDWLAVLRGLAADSALSTHVTGDTQRRFLVQADGKHAWGSGALVQDTNLYREAAGILTTDTKLHVGTELELDGALNHDGTTVGVYGATPVVQEAGWAVSGPPGPLLGTGSMTAYRTALTEASTLLETKRYVATLAQRLYNLGWLGT